MRSRTGIAAFLTVISAAGVLAATVILWAVTSTVSGGGDQGADPNKLVSVTDQLDATSLAAWGRPF